MNYFMYLFLLLLGRTVSRNRVLLLGGSHWSLFLSNLDGKSPGRWLNSLIANTGKQYSVLFILLKCGVFTSIPAMCQEDIQVFSYMPHTNYEVLSKLNEKKRKNNTKTLSHFLIGLNMRRIIGHNLCPKVLRPLVYVHRTLWVHYW